MCGYVYEICLYNSKDCSEVWYGYFAAPEVVGIFLEENLKDAINIIENNITDLYEGYYDFAVIEKIPINKLYHRQHIEERFIYQYSGSNKYNLVGNLQGKNSVYFDTKKIVIKALEGKNESDIRNN